MLFSSCFSLASDFTWKMKEIFGRLLLHCLLCPTWKKRNMSKKLKKKSFLSSVIYSITFLTEFVALENCNSMAFASTVRSLISHIDFLLYFTCSLLVDRKRKKSSANRFSLRFIQFRSFSPSSLWTHISASTRYSNAPPRKLQLQVADWILQIQHCVSLLGRHARKKK